MQATQIEIKEATPADADTVIRLFGALHEYNAQLEPYFALDEGWEELVVEHLRQSQASEESIWLLARHAQRTIGFVLVEVHIDSPLYRHRRWAEIVGLYVEPEYRGTPVAEQLMEYAYAWSVRHNLRIMQLYVTATNVAAHRFYSKQGFRDSQFVMRRELSCEDGHDGARPREQSQRLHFSEGGARPLEMCDQPRDR